MTVELLPSNSDPFEKALMAGAEADLPIPFGAVMDPAETSAEWLPFLAIHEGVRFWFADWSGDRKRQIIDDWTTLASLIGTRAAPARFLAYVDAEIVHKVSHPANRPLDYMALGLDPYDHPAYMARFLVKTNLSAHKAAFCLGLSALDVDALVPIDEQPLDRAMQALTISKAPETQYTVSFGHRVPITLDDGWDLDAGHELDSYRDRNRL